MTPPRTGRYRAAVIGPGPDGAAVAMALTRGGHRVVAVGGGSGDERERLATQVAGVRVAERPGDAAAGTSLVVLAVPAEELRSVVDELVVADVLREGQRVVHLSAAPGLAPLERARLAGAGVAACHPAVRLPPGDPDPDRLVGAAWAVTAAPPDRGWARELVEQLGGTPHDVADAARGLYEAGLAAAGHAGAAVALARGLLLAARVPDPGAFLDARIAADVDAVLAGGAQALAGPVAAADAAALGRHLQLLECDAPTLADAYRDLSRATLALVRAGLTGPQVAALEDVLSQQGPSGRPT